MLKFYSVLFTVLLLISCTEDEKLKPIADTPEIKINEYGLVVDSLVEIKGIVDRNETISDILNPHNVPLREIYRIADASKEVYDFTKINFGKNYTIYSKIDSVETVQYFVYEVDPINYVVCDLTDSINIFSASRNISTKIREVSGIINNSLYMTLIEQNVSELLALKLADVYAWQIDFYGVQAGDYFKVIFEENYVDTQFIGVGRINSALFNHRDKDYYAFRFQQNDKDEYFDEEGNGLRKAFLKAPLKFSRISSGYTNKRFHPILKYYRPHRGIDYAAPTGTPVQSVGDGTVTDVRWTKQGGRFVKVKHNGTYASGYMHLSGYAKGIKPGVRVSQCDIIGYVGSSGLSTGPHLDFRFWKNGQLVNYLRQEFPSSYPIADADKNNFFAFRDSIKSQLDSIDIVLPNPEIASSK